MTKSALRLLFLCLAVAAFFFLAIHAAIDLQPTILTGRSGLEVH